MDNIGGFEKEPTLAVAVSGGADSMALAILADRWARRRGGKCIALTVDHGLRSGSGTEAKETRRRLGERDIPCQVLAWRGEKPSSGIQAAAREARYRLISEWCRRHGVLHLLVAHHREDQAETILHRLARSSGADGLAGMAAIHELAHIRLLRPCLNLARDRLRAVLGEYDVAWSEDPSNENRDFARVRWRALLPVLATEGIDADALSATARRMAAVRACLEGAAANFLGAHAAIYPEGYARVDRAAFAAAASEIAERALVALLTTVGGSEYPPRHPSLEVLCGQMRQRGTKAVRRTLGGCRILSVGTDFLICREAGRCEEAIAAPGACVLWDRRFFIRLPQRGSRSAARFRIGPLGTAGWTEIRQKIAEKGGVALPKPVRFALPAVYERDSIIAVPHLGFNKVAGIRDQDVRFMPAKSASFACFSVV